MKLFLILTFGLCSLTSIGQKAKKESVQTYQHRLPLKYLPAKYSSYSAIFNLNGGEKKIYVDGEYVRNSAPITYNEFWKKEDVYVNLALLKFLNYEIDDKIKKKDKLLIVVDVSNARIDAKINEDQDQTLPFTYTYNWSVDVTTTIRNSATEEEIFKKTETYGNRYKPGSTKKGYKNGFTTYKAAKNYVSKDADKNLIGNEFYKNVGIVETYKDNFTVRFFLADPMPFWSISKEKKFLDAAKLNRTVKEMVNQIKELNKSFKSTTKSPPKVKAKNLIRERKALGFKMSNDTLGLGYRKKLNDLVTNIVIESDRLIPQLNSSDKKQKSILWGMLMNKATAAFVTGKYNKATAILEKAKALDYNKNRTGNLERAIAYATRSYDLLLSEKTKSGEDINPKYFVFKAE